jgi:hypothetical protein
MHIAAPPVPPRLLNASVPPAIEDVVLQLLAKEPDQRPGSMKALAAQLRQVGETLPPDEQPVAPLVPTIKLAPLRPVPTTLSSTTGTLDDAASSRGRRRLTVLALVAGLTAAIGAGLLWEKGPSGMVGRRPAGLLLRIEGGFAASSILADDITRALRKELERHRRITLVPSDDQLALRQATGCGAPEPSCLSVAARRAGARLVIYGTVAREQADRYKLEIVGLDAEKAAIDRRVTDAFGLDVSTEEIERRAVKWAEALEGS